MRRTFLRFPPRDSAFKKRVTSDSSSHRVPQRDTLATRLRERTGDLRVVQAALGHRQLGTTEVYAQLHGTETVRDAIL
jgi:site-specific recombinase XerC